VLGQSWSQASRALIEENPVGESPLDHIIHDDAAAAGESPAQPPAP